MPLSRRYTPEHPPGEECNFGMDFSFIVPVGVGLSSGSLTIWTNRVPPVEDNTDWTIGAVTVRGRAVYASCTGGVEGTDYQFRWVATDTDGKIWPRTALCLCAQTS
jgi:hypothetical protein